MSYVEGVRLIPWPGEPYGPCPGSHQGGEACEADCLAQRAEAAAPCALCPEPIGFGWAYRGDAMVGRRPVVCPPQGGRDDR